MPQSTRRRLPAASTRYLDPVTVPAAPRKVSLGIGVSFYTARKPDSVGFHHRVRRGHRDKLGQEKIVWRFLVEPMGFESTRDMETKEFCGAAWPSKVLKGKRGNPYCPLNAPENSWGQNGRLREQTRPANVKTCVMACVCCAAIP